MSGSSKETFPPPDYSSLIAEDKELVVYRPRLNKVSGGVLSTIMLQQILYWFGKSNDKPFYKFFAPCKHPDYREGDSWEEELGFTRTEVQSALNGFAKKVNRGGSREEAYKENIVIYWTDRDRKTWYVFNRKLFNERLHQHYLPNAASEHYLMQESCITVNQESCITYSTETTTETNNRDSDLQSGEPQKTASPQREEEKKNKESKTVSYRHHAFTRFREIEKECKEELGWEPDPLPESKVKEYAAFYERAAQEGHSLEDLDDTIRWLFAKASGLVPNEPQAWCSFGTALRSYRKKPIPRSGTRSPEALRPHDDRPENPYSLESYLDWKDTKRMTKEAS